MTNIANITRIKEILIDSAKSKKELFRISTIV